MTQTNIKQLKQQCHHLKPVVWVGQNGLSDNVMAEIDQALEHHELVKIKLPSENKSEREQQIGLITESTVSEVIQDIGHMLCLYRESNKK